MSREISRRVGFIRGLVKAGNFEGHETVHEVFMEMLKVMEMMEKRLNELEDIVKETEKQVQGLADREEGLKKGMDVLASLAALADGAGDYDGEYDDGGDYPFDEDDDAAGDDDLLYLHGKKQECPNCGSVIQNKDAMRCPNCGKKL